MKERYKNWKELKPLTAPVPVGTKCVVISAYKAFVVGDIVTTLEESSSHKCKDEIGRTECMTYFELALLPSDSAEPAKVERKIVQIATDANFVYALCDDGTAWKLAKVWKQLPPIPQDAV